MSTTFEPREVDKPFVWRWLKLTLKLFVRSPIRFGVLIALLGSLDTSAVMLAQGYAVQKAWIDRLGMLMLPLLWIVVSAVARGADDSNRTREGLAGLRRMPAWRGALAVGVGLAALNWAIAGTLRGLAALLRHQQSDSYLQHQGQLLDSLLANIMLMIIAVGLCYFPLLVLAPEVAPGQARHLSNEATALNGELVIWFLIGSMVIAAAALTEAVPAYGMTTAAFLVYMGVLNYVAYRDIFERHAENMPDATVSAVEPRAASGTI